MKTGGGSAAQKRRAGQRAAQAVEDGMVVGLGTGSTTRYAIDALGEAVAAGLEIRGIPTSLQARQTAIEAGIPLVGLDEVDGVDLAIDGADQVADGDLIKGGGGAHVNEKVIATAAERFLVVADPSKLSDCLERSVPVAVVPDARPLVAARVRDAGGEPSLRAAAAKDGPVVTENGNLILDCTFGPISEPAELATTLSAIPGVVDHGLFVGVADAIYIGTDDGVAIDRY